MVFDVFKNADIVSLFARQVKKGFRKFPAFSCDLHHSIFSHSKSIIIKYGNPLTL